MTPPPTHAPARRLALALSTLFVFNALSAAATAQAPSAAPTPASTPVRLEIMLTGGKGRPAPEVRREDVRVFVGGVERPVVLFEKEELPVSYGLVVDNSGSLRSQFGRVVAASETVVAANAAGDEAFVVRFVGSENIRMIQGMTADERLLRNALGQMFLEKGQTALLDALHLACEYLVKNAGRGSAGKRRLALLLVTDGEERNSFHGEKAVIKLLREGGVQVFCVGLTGELDNYPGFVTESRRGKARDLLTELATETGGRVFFAEKPGQLEEAVAEAVRNMRTRYVVGFEPPAQTAPKGGGKVEVKLTGAPAKEKLKAVVVTPKSPEAGGRSK